MLKNRARELFPFIPADLGECSSFLLHDGFVWLTFWGVVYKVDEENKKLLKVIDNL